MLPLTQNFAAIFLALYCGFCYGFVLISSASAGTGGLSEKHFFEVGSAWNYKYVTRILLSEKGDNVKDIGFSVGADVLVESVWGSGYNRLLKFTVNKDYLIIFILKTMKKNNYQRFNFAEHFVDCFLVLTNVVFLLNNVKLSGSKVNEECQKLRKHYLLMMSQN